MKTDNYLVCVISPEARRMLRPDPGELYFPFATNDTKSAQAAQLAAEAKRRELEARDVAVELACYRFCSWFDLPVISGDPQAIPNLSPRPIERSRERAKSEPRRGYGEGRRLGERPWWESHNVVEAAR